MFHILRPPLLTSFLCLLLISLCIILLKARLLPVTVGERVACGRHNLTAQFSMPVGKKKVVPKLEITGSQS